MRNWAGNHVALGNFLSNIRIASCLARTMGWMKPCIAITFAGWKPPMSILITGDTQHRVAGKFTAWNFRTKCSKRYITSTQSVCFGNSTAQQNYRRGLNETALLADTTFCCLMEIDRKSTRLNSSHVAISYAVFC